MPIDYSLYPPDWKTVIRPRIMARARHCCEGCGVANHSTVLSKSRVLLCDPQPYRDAASNVGFYHTADERATVIVLTIAHLDHDTSNNEDSNLKALCQRCHLTHDAGHHSRNARKTREAKGRQLVLF
jgi:hypothetical protein